MFVEVPFDDPTTDALWEHGLLYYRHKHYSGPWTPLLDWTPSVAEVLKPSRTGIYDFAIQVEE